MSIINFKTRISEFNTSNLNDLAASLAQAFSVHGSTGMVVNSMNINNLNVSGLSILNGGILLTGGTVLGYYQEYTLTGAWQGPSTFPTGIIKVNKIGNNVILRLPGSLTTQTSSAPSAFSFSSLLPIQFRPPNNVSTYGISTYDNSPIIGFTVIGSNGSISLFSGLTATSYNPGHTIAPVYNNDYSFCWSTV